MECTTANSTVYKDSKNNQGSPQDYFKEHIFTSEVVQVTYQIKH